MAYASHQHAAAGEHMTDHDFRRGRHIKRNVRLHRDIRDLIDAHPSANYVGGNDPVETIARRLGFEPHDLAITDMRMYDSIVTIVCVPHRIWNNPYRMALAIDLRHQAQQAGFRAILVPQSIVEREPRLGNSKLLAGTANTKVDATSRMRVLVHLIENGACCLSELANLIDHPDPFGAVLHLATAGAISVDMDKAINPYSMIDIANPTSAVRH